MPRTNDSPPGGGALWWRAFALGVFAAIALGIVPTVVVGSQATDAGQPDPRAGAGDPNGRSHAPPTSEPTVSATEFAFDPTDLAVPADEEVTVELVNDGGTVHNWTVLDEEIADESEFDEALVVGGVPDVNGGQAGTGALTLEVGEYQVICTIAGHLDAGMQGRVTAE